MKIDINKTAGPDGVSGYTLRVCTDQLDVVANMYYLLLRHTCCPYLFKSIVIVPVPKKSVVRCLNDYHTVDLPLAQLILSKCFERLLLSHIKSSIPTDLDKHQFAY